MLKKSILFAIIAAFIVAGCGGQNTGNTGNADPVDNVDSGGNTAAIATVNGETITQSEYELAFQQMKQNYLDQGIDIDGEDVTSEDKELLESQVLDSLINQKLLEQKIQELNITVSEEEIEMEMSQVKAQFDDDEQFNAALVANDLTIEKLREDISLHLKVDQYIESESEEVSVTEEEIQQFYDEAVAGVEDAPPFEEVKGYIEEDLLNEKRYQARERIVQDIRSASTIEYL